MVKKEEKARRMELRKELGNRVVEPPAPDPKGPNYLVAHACFDCKKSFKIWPRDEAAACPDCGNEIHWMGRSFRSPKKTDIQQWRKVKLLYAYGFRFVGSGSWPPLPERLQEVEQFVIENPEHPLRVAEPDDALLSER